MLSRRFGRTIDQKSGKRCLKMPAILGLAAVFFLAAAFLVVPAIGRAQVDLGLNYATATGLSTTDIRTTVGNIIKAFLALLGIIAVVLILYAGVLWMTASGNEEKIVTAKKVLVNATIGLAIIMSSYAITYFIFQAIQGGEGGAIGTGGGGSALTSMYCSDCGPDQLGKILEYHYPEVGQTGVPRNTKIAITMKKPLMLSTVFQNYDDKGTYDTADDVICSPDCATAGHQEIKCAGLSETQCAMAPGNNCAPVDGKCVMVPVLNTNNVKILPNESLGPTKNTQNKDADFDARYPAAANGILLNPAPRAMVSQVDPSFNSQNKGQTITLKPVNPIGSSDRDMNYRVALRGGPNGVQIWGGASEPGAACGTQNKAETSAKCAPAFSSLKADGSYFWTFTTSTALDTTPPQLSKMFPFVQTPTALANPNKVQNLARNQLLQVYFDEAVDPTTATGKTGTGTGEGFNWINIEARCLPDKDCPFGKTDFTALSGKVEIANRYRTAEFTPSTACEGIAENSCGEPVYCLPKNVEVRVTVKAASVDAKAQPAANFPPNGVTDMVGNSFDGNKDGKGQGPTGNGLSDYDLNRFFGAAPADVSTYSDSNIWLYHVGDEVDLVPPQVLNILPLSAPPDDKLFPDGPSKVPTGKDQNVVVEWSKVMSPTSMTAGTNVYINSSEWRKTASKACTAATLDKCEKLAPPPVVVEISDPLDDGAGHFHTVMNVLHREFFNANDLGWSEQDASTVVPKYLPVIRAQVKDTTQNCFFPSVGYECTGVDAVNSSCYNRTSGSSFDWKP